MKYFRPLLLLATVVLLGVSAPALAVIPNPGPQNGSIGLQATISSNPPTQAATIATPANGASFSSLPVTVSGLCQSNLLVKIFSNNVFAGSTVCSAGSYSLQISLFSGQNSLVARVYDALDQTGPDSNTVNVTYNDAQFAQFGTQLTLTSAYAERGSPPGNELDWPILLNGGTGPYAISVDWGDNSASDLLSASDTGTVVLKHTYQTAGVYRVIVKATDKNGDIAFLQLVGQATGAIQSNSSGAGSGDAGINGSGKMVIEKSFVWWPMAIFVPLLGITFWIGRRHELYTLRRKLEETR